jgi:hypothetical protein
MDPAPDLVLVRASVSRKSGKWADDDYDVWDGNAKVVGRIVLATVTPAGRPWFWTITERVAQQPTQRGYAATREEALADFKAAWERGG